MTSPPRRQQDDDFVRLLERAHRGLAPERTGCPEAATIAAYVEHSLDEAERAQFERHAADCARCAEALALLVVLDEHDHAAPAVPAASRRGLWRWLVPVATVVLVLVVWRELPREADTTVSDTRTPAVTSTAPGAPPSIPVRPPQPASPTSQPPQPLMKESVRELRRNKAPEKLQAQGDAPSARKAGPPRTDAQPQRFEAPAAKDEALGGPGSPAPAAAPGAATESTLQSQQAENVTIAALQVRSPDGAVVYRIAAGHGVQRSTDGGRTWVTEPAPFVSRLEVGSAPSGDVCWLAGAAGTVLRRSSTGTWHRAFLPQPLDITEIAATSETAAVVTTTDGSRWQTTDGGTHWEPL